MLRPFVSKYVSIVNHNHEFQVVASTGIPANTIIEISPVVNLSTNAGLLISKDLPTFEKKFAIDSTALDKEYEIFAQLGEFELEKKLDSGEISEADYVRILRSKINVNSILNAKSHGLVLGNGMLYQISEYPNLLREFYVKDNVCVFKTIQYVNEGELLTYYNN